MKAKRKLRGSPFLGCLKEVLPVCSYPLLMEGTCWHHGQALTLSRTETQIFCRLQLLSFHRKSISMTQQKLSYFVCKIVYRVMFKHAHHAYIIINYSNPTALQTPPQETKN